MDRPIDPAIRTRQRVKRILLTVAVVAGLLVARSRSFFAVWESMWERSANTPSWFLRRAECRSNPDVWSGESSRGTSLE